MEISNLPDRIFICGFMGAGKSTVGMKLAEKLGLSFLDLDEKIVERAGKEIPEIFEQSGETAFRTLERRTVLNVITCFKGVVALGGGALQNQHLVDHIKLKGLLVFIETPLRVAFDRISQDPRRPLLLGKDGTSKKPKVLLRELKTLYEDRLPYYEQAVIKVRDEGDQSIEAIVNKLSKKIRSHVEYY